MPEYRILELITMVERGEISVPELQREFVWSDNQVKELAESIYKGYPIGLITLYKLPEGFRNGKYWVLDGQQRLLSLTLIFKGRTEVLKEGRPQIKILEIWFDPKNERFEIRPPKKDKNWIKLPEVLKIGRRLDLEKFLASKNLEPEEKERISALWGIFREDYKVLVHELREDLDLDDLGNIFVRTNFAGTRVRGSDVYSTMIAIAQPELVKELREFCGSLPIKIDYGVLIRTFVAFLTKGKVKLASRVLDQADKLKSELEKNKNSIKNIVDDAKNCIKKAIELLREDMGIMASSDRYLPTENVLPVMAYYIKKRGQLSEEDKKGLLKWFVLASYFRRYSSAAETRLNEDLSEIEKGGSYKDLIKKLEEREGNLRERIKDDISRGEWNELLLYAILRWNNAKDFRTHEILTTSNLTVHHIFPTRFIKGSEYEDILEDIGNITLLTLETNQRLSSELPQNYLQRIPSEIRKSHLIPEDQNLWKLENCREFVEERKELLKEFVEKHILFELS